MYQELRQKSMGTMMKVVLYSTAIAVTSYILAGFFGYATFATNPQVVEIMEK